MIRMGKALAMLLGKAMALSCAFAMVNAITRSTQRKARLYLKKS